MIIMIITTTLLISSSIDHHLLHPAHAIAVSVRSGETAKE